MFPVKRLNHAVLYVRDVDRAAAFYQKAFGFEVVERIPGVAAFLKAHGTENHHDLGLFSVGPDAQGPQRGQVGLYHLAWEVPTIEDLAKARKTLADLGALVGESDHGATKSVYAHDPDGNEFEVMWMVPREHWGRYEHRGVVEPLDLDAELARGMTDLELRPGVPEDADELGRICYEAFHAIATEHNFPPDFPSAEFATFVVSTMLTNPRVYSVVATVDGRIVGSNFLDERSTITGVGPITVDPTIQNSRIGRALMDDVIRRSDEQGAPGIRLVQSGYHNRSFSLYMKLGFDVREQLAALNGPVLDVEIEAHAVRTATDADLDECGGLCRRVHGVDRTNELADAIGLGAALVVRHDGRITGYTSGLGFMGHSVGESNDDLEAMLGSGREILGPGILVPTRNGEVLRWALDHGLRVVQLMTLMSRGLYTEPAAPFFPSILF